MVTGKAQSAKTRRLNMSKKILVIGGTGAQGSRVVSRLLTSKFSVRVLSRDPESEYVKALFAGKNVELVAGSWMDEVAVKAALRDCYGIFVNTDSNHAKAADEIFAAMRIYELARATPTIRHLLWSGIDYHLKVAGFDPRYGSYHTNAKGRFNEFLQNQPSSPAQDGFTWSIINTGAYMEMLSGGLFAPVIQPDGARVFAMPLGKGHLPLMALDDLANFATIMFEDKSKWSGKTLNVASQFATGKDVAEATSKISGVKAVYKPITFDEWNAAWPLADLPVSSTDPRGPTWGQSFRMWWNAFEDDILLNTRDFDKLRSIYPGLTSVEDWMRQTGYDGTAKPLLKSFIDAKAGPGF